MKNSESRFEINCDIRSESEANLSTFQTSGTAVFLDNVIVERLRAKTSHEEREIQRFSGR